MSIHGEAMIDWNQIRELRSATGKEDFAVIVDLFLEEVEESLRNLENRTGAEDLRAGLHFLKGSALNLGFTGLSCLCQQGERTGTMDIAEIRGCFARSRADFLAGLGLCEES
ncbi:Hpt domain-containing protein [Roseovarius sp. TE539]|uniref:Hpt domain-containing protein n=1 Tax=Roseovarius sp. TE539 TaxID=2249812 RepID=UPI00215CAE12|nr:Hpt domain-containing protein [Roseovarius sp. TE539]